LQVIVEKMVEYLRGVTDDVAKADVVQRISDLAERYAPDTQWFIDTMNQAGPQPLHSILLASSCTAHDAPQTSDIVE
jgi:hypothetical protein